MEFPMHWLIILVVVLILFGGRKIPELMRGMGEGVRGFRKHPATIHSGASPAQSAATEKPTKSKKS